MAKYLDKQGLQTLWGLIKEKIANLADGQSTIYLTDDEHLSIKGYEEAKQGQMLVKDSVEGLAWINPLSEERLQQAVANAEHSASEAANQAVLAGNKAIEADTSAKQAQRINEQTMAWVNNKFWWGTIEEYNQLESIEEGTFYFVQM